MDTLIDVSKYMSGSNDEYSDRPEIFLLGKYTEWILKGERLLDLGCGTGNFVTWLRDRGKHAEGVTYQLEEILFGQQKNCLPEGVLHHADLHKLPFEDASFDTLIIWDALEHCVSPLVALCEARRVVTEGGRCICFIPGKNWWNCKYHILCPTIAQMIHLCWHAGWEFEIIHDYSKAPEHGQEHMAVYLMKACEPRRGNPPGESLA